MNVRKVVAASASAAGATVGPFTRLVNKADIVGLSYSDVNWQIYAVIL